MNRYSWVSLHRLGAAKLESLTEVGEYGNLVVCGVFKMLAAWDLQGWGTEGTFVI